MRLTTNVNYRFNWGSDRVKIKQVLFLDRYYLFIDCMDGTPPTVYHARKVLVESRGWATLLDKKISRKMRKTCSITKLELMHVSLLGAIE